MTACATIFNRYYRAPKRVVASSGPTVILNAAYLTDTLLTPGSNPVGNGDPVESWATATGGTFNYGLAASAGASVNPIYIAASGVHTNGTSAALTCATPVTIPADTDVDIWAYIQYTAGSLVVFGTTNSIAQLNISDGGTIISNADDSSMTDAGAVTAGAKMFRFGRASGVWTLAYTGRASASMTDSELGNLAIAYDTLHGYSGSGAGLENFSATGNYIRALRIATYPDGYSGRAAYRSAYEIATAGAALT